MSANSDNPAGMSTRWLRQRVNELSASLADMTQTVWELNQTVSQLSENLENTSTLAADNADRIHALELSVWRYHERPGLMARLVAIGYDETEAAETVDMLVATGIDAAEQGVTLREQLATLRYTPPEIEECIEDVPGISQADIDYAKEILDGWDPATTSLNKAFQGDSRLVVFPKIDTSNVTDTAYMFDKCGSLGYVPWFDTSKVTSATFMFGWNEPYGHVKRLSDFKWDSLRTSWGPYTGLPELKHVPSPLDLSHTNSINRLFAGGGTQKPEPFPEILLPSEGNVTITLLCDVTGTRFPITEFPDNVVSLKSLYAYGKVSGNLSEITFRAHGVKNAENMLGWNFNITHGPKIDMPQLENMKDFLVFMEGLVYVPDYSACAPKLVDGMLKPSNQTGKIRRVEGLNFARVTDGHLFGGDVRFPQYQLTYMRVINLGQSELASYPDFACALKWGTGSEEARQSLVDSLLTDSYDRATAGMAPATVRLSTASKAALTAEEIAAITAKGFTIA